MDDSKLTLKKASTVFGCALLDALNKGKGNTSAIDSGKISEIQAALRASSQVDELLKEALKEETIKKEKLDKKRAKASNKKPLKPRLSDVERLRNEVSSLSKMNHELRKKISSLQYTNLNKDSQNLLIKALEEIKKIRAKNTALESENKALRRIIENNIAKSLGPQRDIVHYGGQYSEAQT